MLLRIAHSNNPEEYTILTKGLWKKKNFATAERTVLGSIGYASPVANYDLEGVLFLKSNFVFVFFFAKFSGSQENQVKKNSVVKGTHLQP